jgi:hypothetical protein
LRGLIVVFRNLGTNIKDRNSFDLGSKLAHLNLGKVPSVLVMGWMVRICQLEEK